MSNHYDVVVELIPLRGGPTIKKIERPPSIWAKLLEHIKGLTAVAIIYFAGVLTSSWWIG